MTPGDDHALVERVHDLAAFAGATTKKVPTIEDDDRDRAEHQRDTAPRCSPHVAHHQAAQQHGGDQRHGVGLEQVGGHAGAVADVVADVVGDHRRIARIVLRNAGLDLADEVGADVRALGEYAAAQAREDRDQRAAEGEADQRAQRRSGVAQQRATSAR